MQHIITKDTQFPIIQNGENTTISSNELLNNIVCVLDNSKYKQDINSLNSLQNQINCIRDSLEKIEDSLRKISTISKIAKQQSDENRNMIFNQKIDLDESIKGFNTYKDKISKYVNFKEDTLCGYKSTTDKRLADLESTLNKIINAVDGDIVNVGTSQYLYKDGKWNIQ